MRSEKKAPALQKSGQTERREYKSSDTMGDSSNISATVVAGSTTLLVPLRKPSWKVPQPRMPYN